MKTQQIHNSKFIENLNDYLSKMSFTQFSVITLFFINTSINIKRTKLKHTYLLTGASLTNRKQNYHIIIRVECNQ